MDLSAVSHILSKWEFWFLFTYMWLWKLTKFFSTHVQIWPVHYSYNNTNYKKVWTLLKFKKYIYIFQNNNKAQWFVNPTLKHSEHT